MNKFNLMAMNKQQLTVALICVLIIGEGAGLVYFSIKSRDLSKKLAVIKPGYQKLTQEDQELQGKYTQLSKENEALKVDRNNVLLQTKSLMGERTRANDLTVSLEQANLGISQLKKEKEESQNFILSLKDEIQKLQDTQLRLTKDREDSIAAYNKIKNSSRRKELEKETARLNKVKSSLEGKLKNKNKENEQLKAQRTKLEATREQLTGQIKEQRKTINEAISKNRRLAAEVKNIPSKFSEIARQNTKLIKETSEMHYNLGVFYTKNKEYLRAVAEFEKVVEITPDDAYAHFNLGYIYSEYLVDRSKAIEHFRYFLRLAKSGDKDVDWVKKYLLTWETYEGKKPMQ